MTRRAKLTLEQGHTIITGKSWNGAPAKPECKRALADLYRMLNALRAGARP